VIAHVGGVPVEELLLPLMTVGSGLALVMTRIRARAARRGAP
jgi:hypothetical protein